MIPWHFSCDLLCHYGKAIFVYSKRIMRLDPRFDNSTVALYYSFLRFVFLDFFATAQTPFFVVFDCAFQRFIVEIVGVKLQLFRYQKLRFNPRPCKMLCGHTVVLDKAHYRKRRSTENIHPAKCFYSEIRTENKVQPYRYTAGKQKTNYRSDSSKNILSV